MPRRRPWAVGGSWRNLAEGSRRPREAGCEEGKGKCDSGERGRDKEVHQIKKQMKQKNRVVAFRRHRAEKDAGQAGSSGGPCKRRASRTYRKRPRGARYREKSSGSISYEGGPKTFAKRSRTTLRVSLQAFKGRVEGKKDKRKARRNEQTKDSCGGILFKRA